MKKLTWITAAFLLGGMFAACGGDKDLYDNEPAEKEKPAENKQLLPESSYPDFNTTSDVTFDLNYGALGQRILLQLYTEDPQQYDSENGIIEIKGEAVYKIFTDDKGRFQGNVELPAGLQTVYIYTDAIGVRRFAEAKVQNGKVSMDFTSKPSTTRRLTRAAGDYRIWNLGQSGVFNPLYSVVGWEGNAYGRITDDNGGLLTDGTFSADDLKAIKPYLGNNKTSEFSKHLAGTDVVNTTIAPTYTDENGNTVTTVSAQVYVTYIGEMGAWLQDGLGYYYYKTGEAPATRNEAISTLKHYMIIPNTSVAADAPYLGNKVGMVSGYYNYGEENAPAWPNERVQLLFEDPETGEITTQFPPGYTIGFFQVSKAHWGSNSCQDETYKVGTYRLWYSNEAWNNNNAKHFSALGYKDKILYGVEDGENTSFNDLVFSVEADPSGAIKNPERAEIDVVVPDEDVTESRNYTYAYEDIWPTGGDYDLNDVIVEHTRTVTFDSYNYVKRVDDVFKAVQPVGSADYTDAFAIQIAANQRGNITLPADAIDETDINTIILFSSAKDVRNREFTVTRTFSGKALTKPGLENEDINPFIIANFKGEANNRTEVHLPKHKATAKANQSQIGTADDAYYTNKDGMHPFALKVPNVNNYHFQPVTEQVSIENEYLQYTKWVESRMQENTSWYLYYTKK